jgi:hypothetical protein
MGQIKDPWPFSLGQQGSTLMMPNGKSEGVKEIFTS